MSAGLDIVVFATALAHVLLAPYTKVEESFGLHATHDVLMYGVGREALHNFDHFTFPGAVPRTFIGSVLLAWLSTPVIQLANSLGLVSTKFDLQIIVRLVLASANAVGLCLVRRAVSRRFGRPTGLLFTLLTCSQFHIPFWMGRTLPNMFALFPVNVASYLLIDRAPNATKPSETSISTAISLLTFTVVVFRTEIVLLLAPLVLQSLVSRHITLSNVLKTGVLSGFASLALTVTVDSYFWDRAPLWPELVGLYFNVYQGKSSQWGTSPPHTYLTSYLPKLLLSSVPLSLIGYTLDPRIRALLFPSVVFIGLISTLGHKEWRFIVYVVPIFNVAAARGARWMVSRRKNNSFGRIMFLGAFGLLIINILATYLLTLASNANYPGGKALAFLHLTYPREKIPSPHVHISNLAAQSGASLFLQINSPPYPSLSLSPMPSSSTNWIYNKTESLAVTDLTASKFITHLISESAPDTIVLAQWRVVESVAGFDRWYIDWDLIKAAGKGELRRMWGVLQMETKEKLWILERKSSRS